ncbi:MAG TPA: hypothetical protein VMA86_02485 [Acetobacteraceae bacterium]|nr:hypothetical protein [Acetobacteraceae bacterium]
MAASEDIGALRLRAPGSAPQGREPGYPRRQVGPVGGTVPIGATATRTEGGSRKVAPDAAPAAKDRPHVRLWDDLGAYSPASLARTVVTIADDRTAQ